MLRGVLLTVIVAASSALAGEDEPFTLDPSSALKLTVGHVFDRGVARERIGYLLEYWSKRFGVQAQWQGDKVYLTGSVWGVEIKAVFTVQERAVFAIAHDPGTVFASAAQGYVAKKLRKYLHPTYDDP